MYDIYKTARDMSWQCLIDNGVRELPVYPVAIAKHYGITCHSSTQKLLQGCSGLLRVINGELHIFTDSEQSVQRQRYTIAHEIGHYLLGHLDPAAQSEHMEYAADRFAADLLMPACVLWGLDVHTPEEIARLCRVSMQAARIRAERMAVLYKRGKFLVSPLERQVYSLFSDFIQNSKR